MPRYIINKGVIPNKINLSKHRNLTGNNLTANIRGWELAVEIYNVIFFIYQ